MDAKQHTELVAQVRAGIKIHPDEPTDVMVSLELDALTALDSLEEQLEAAQRALQAIADLDPDWTGRDGDSVYAIARAALASSPASSPFPQPALQDEEAGLFGVKTYPGKPADSNQESKP